MNLLEINSSRLLEILKTDVNSGLKSEDVEKNRKEFSPSTVRPPKSLLSVFKGVFSDVMPMLFTVLCLISFKFEGGAGAWLSLGLFAVVYVLMKFIAIRYTAKVSEHLNKVSTKVIVIRDGKPKKVDYTEVVPGDIMLLRLGDTVPCDVLVLYQEGLSVSEIQLTGRSTPIFKLPQDDVLIGKGIPYYDCIIFAGSVVVSGTAKVLVCNTGDDVFDKKNKLTSRSGHAHRTRIFEISSFISQQISLLWILLSFILFIMGVLKGGSVFDVMYLTAALAAASLPDAAIVLFDITLSVSSERLYKKGCIIRDMSSIDRMCDISCIMVDNSRYFRHSVPKPNTVYVNGEQRKFRGASDDSIRDLFELAVLASISGRGMTYNGASVEKTIINHAGEIGINVNDLNERNPIIEKRPFNAQNNMSRVIIYRDDSFIAVSIGSPSNVLKICSDIEYNGETHILDERTRRTVRDVSRIIAARNEGVIAVAVKKIEYREGAGQINSERGYSFKGYIGLHTPIRADAAHAVSTCHKSEMDVVVMTSDGRSTATGFAKSLSILRDGGKVIESKELAEIDRGLFRADIKDYKVYVGLTPEEKATIVSYRKEHGDITAVTASKLSDLGLFLEADVSFCPSDSGDEAMRQNADVITNGSFEAIPECIRYARSIYRHTRHTLQYVLNFQFILFFTVFLSMLFMGAPVMSVPSLMTYAVLVALPLSTALAARSPKGNELKDSFGEQLSEINAQNLLLIPGICGFVTALAVCLSARSAFVTSAVDGIMNGSSFITLISTSVFMAYVLSSDMGRGFEALKSGKLALASLFALGVMLTFTLIPSLAGVLKIVPPAGYDYAVSFFTGLVPPLVCIGIKLVQKFVFNKKK